MSDQGTEESSDSKPERTLIGSHEEDFEAVLIDGILGFSLSFGNAILLMAGAVLNMHTYYESAFVLILAALIASLLFKVVQLNTDAISARSPRLFYVCCHAICFTVAIIGMFINQPIVSGAAAAIALADTLILYGRFLSSLARKALMLVVDASFIYPGIMMIVIINISSIYSSLILSAMVLITVIVALLFVRKKYDFGELVSAADSKKRSIQVKGNVHTLFLAGFMVGALLLFQPLGFTSDISSVVIGLTFAIAGVASLIMRNTNERGLKDSLRKSMALVCVVLLLPLALVPNEAKLVLLGIYGCYAVVTSLIILDAIIETVRFNILAAMWLLGKEGSMYFCGLAVGGALFATLPFLAEYMGDVNALLVLCIVASAVAAWMQIKVNYQIYPYEPIIEEKVDDEVTANLERNGRRKVLWHQKIDTACEQYHLSPREREILPILLRGRDAKYIMDTFYISQSTAKTHIYNIYRKFGIHSRQELLDFVEDMELVDLISPEDQISDDPQTTNTSNS